MAPNKLSGKRLYVVNFSWSFSEYYASKRNTKYYRGDSKMFTKQLRAILTRQERQEIASALAEDSNY